MPTDYGAIDRPRPPPAIQTTPTTTVVLEGTVISPTFSIHSPRYEEDEPLVAFVTRGGEGFCRSGQKHDWVMRYSWPGYLCCFCMCFTPRYRQCSKCGMIIASTS